MESTEEDLTSATLLLPPAPPRLLLPPHPVPAAKWGLWGRIVRRYRLLLFRPKKFFTGMTAPRGDVELLLLAFSIGLAGALNSAELRLARDTASVASRSWPAYWLQSLGTGVIVAALTYYVSAAIWMLLVGWSGRHDADIRLVRRVCFSTAQITAIPIIIKTLVDTLIHESPLAAALADPTWQHRMFLVFPVWGFVVGFIGVRTVFRTRPLRTAVWFLILPISAYLMLIFTFFNLRRVAGPVLTKGQAADVGHFKEFGSPTMAFSYPGNWAVLTAAPDYDPKAYVELRPVQDARFRVRFIKPTKPCEDFARAIAESVMARFEAATRPQPMPSWGPYKGSGLSFKVYFRGHPYQVRVFVAPIAKTAYLDVFEMLAEADGEKVQPGFDLIRNTFSCRWK